MISIQINSQDVQAHFRKLLKPIREKNKYLMDIANEILRLSQFEVPHDLGTLQNSGTVEEVGEDIIIGYHTPYAARLHEHPEYRFQKGRKGKYIEDPINRNLNQLGLRAVKSLEDNIKKI